MIRKGVLASVLNVQLRPVTFMWSDVFIEPQEGHHFDIEVPLISISQLPIELVQVCIGDHGFDLADLALSLFHRDTRASDVPPHPQPFNSIRVATKVFGITWVANLLVLPPLPAVAATVLAALPRCLFFMQTTSSLEPVSSVSRPCSS